MKKEKKPHATVSYKIMGMKFMQRNNNLNSTEEASLQLHKEKQAQEPQIESTAQTSTHSTNLA